MIDVDKILGIDANGYRDGTAGFSGDRFFVERLEDAPGFKGIFHVCHCGYPPRPKCLDAPLPLRLFKDHRVEETIKYNWYPSHIQRYVKAGDVCYFERKTITRDDVGICEITLTNFGPASEALSLSLEADPVESLEAYGHSFYMARAISSSGEKILKPGETCRLFASVAVDVTRENTESKAKRALNVGTLDKAIDDEREFYDSVIPEFHCSDSLVEQIYYYRNYVLRRNLANPGIGNLKYPVFYEGRDGCYSRAITASAALTIDEGRWWKQPHYIKGHVKNYLENLPAHGMFRDIWINEIRNLDWPGYEEWIICAMCGFLDVYPDDELSAEIISAGVRNINGLLALKDKNSNLLLNPGGHHMTQEHSPAFTYFHEYRDWYDYTDIERIEYQAFFYGNIISLARLMEHKSDSRADKYFDLARRVKDATLKAMWHEDDKFFYAVRESDGAFARCKEANGFLAFLNGLAPFEKPYTDIFKYLVDTKYFWNPYPISSCAKDVPVYSPHQMHWGSQRKDTGDTWSGPTWPYMDSLVMNVMADLIRSGQPSCVTVEHLKNLFHMFTLGHYENSLPMIRENWDGISGKQRGCADYLHSTYIDLVVRHVLGFEPRQPAGKLSPLMNMEATVSALPTARGPADIEIDSKGNGNIKFF